MKCSPALALAFVLAGGSLARAEPPPGDRVGRFPPILLGVVGGLGISPVPYELSSGAPSTHDVFSGILGPEAYLHVDARAFLVTVQGMVNVVGSNPRWMTRGQIVLGKGLGFRTTHNVLKSMSDRSVGGGYVVRTTEHYVHKHVPMFIGLSGGVTLWGVGEAEYESYLSGPTGLTRDAALLPTVDVGITLKSPQFEIMVAPMYELATASRGLRWAYGMAFPVGDRPLFFRFSGDHVFGDDPLDQSGRRMSTILLVTLGSGSGMQLGL